MQNFNFTLPIHLKCLGVSFVYSGIQLRAMQNGERYCQDIRCTADPDIDFVIRIGSPSPNFRVITDFDILGPDLEPVGGLEVLEVSGRMSNDAALSRAVSELVDAFRKKLHPEMYRSRNFSFDDLSPDVKGQILVSAIGVGTSVLLACLRNLPVWSTKIKNAIQNKRAATVYEEQLNQDMFGNQTGNEPEFNCYSNLVHSLDMILERPSVKSLILCGPPGTSKTHMVRRTLYFHGLKAGVDYVLMKGASLDSVDFVAALYNSRKGILVLDDFDSPLEDSNIVNLLKSATDSYGRRIISVPRIVNLLKSATDSYGRRIISVPRAVQISKLDSPAGEYSFPERFEFEGKLIIITNKSMDELDRALISRSLTIEIKFDVEEFLQNIQAMIKYIMPECPVQTKQEVFDFIAEKVQSGEVTNINFRTFQNAVTMRTLYPNWQEMILYALR